MLRFTSWYVSSLLHRAHLLAVAHLVLQPPQLLALPRVKALVQPFRVVREPRHAEVRKYLRVLVRLLRISRLGDCLDLQVDGVLDSHRCAGSHVLPDQPLHVDHAGVLLDAVQLAVLVDALDEAEQRGVRGALVPPLGRGVGGEPGVLVPQPPLALSLDGRLLALALRLDLSQPRRHLVGVGRHLLLALQLSRLRLLQLDQERLLLLGQPQLLCVVAPLVRVLLAPLQVLQPRLAPLALALERQPLLCLLRSLVVIAQLLHLAAEVHLLGERRLLLDALQIGLPSLQVVGVP